MARLRAIVLNTVPVLLLNFGGKLQKFLARGLQVFRDLAQRGIVLLHGRGNLCVERVDPFTEIFDQLRALSIS